MFRYPVSDFAKELLKKIHKDPLFNIGDIAPNLYNNVRALAFVKVGANYFSHFYKCFLKCSSKIKEINYHKPLIGHPVAFFM